MAEDSDLGGWRERWGLRLLFVGLVLLTLGGWRLGVWAFASPDRYLLQPPVMLRQEYDVPGLPGSDARQVERAAEREAFRQRARDHEAQLGGVGCGLGLLLLGIGVWFLRENPSKAELGAAPDPARDKGAGTA